jgi:acetate kinase
MTGRFVLTLNAGSATVKAALFALTAPPHQPHERPGWSATYRRYGEAPHLELRRGEAIDELPGDGELPAVLATMVDDIERSGIVRSREDVVAVGHRVVHGGPELRAPVRLDPDIRRRIGDADALAPLHNGPALELIDAAADSLPGATHVAVFDTAFHATIPDAAAVYGGPHAWWDRGWRRYGFHGLSQHDAVERAAALLGRPREGLQLVVVHLGGGCSVTAVRDGHSVDTTMGLTPTDGLIMATRCGSVDPGLLLLALREAGGDLDAFERVLNEHSGIAGLTGTTADVAQARQLAERGDERAALAVAAYVHRVRSAIGAMVVAAGGFDALVFTGGAVESDPRLRADIVEGLAVLGVRLDHDGNERVDGAADALISSPGGVPVIVIGADEERVIAGATAALAPQGGAGPSR